MNPPRTAAAIAVINDKILLIGGFNHNDGVLDSVQEFDPATESWCNLPPMPTPRLGLAAAVVDGIVYAIAGESTRNLDVVEAYTPPITEIVAIDIKPGSFPNSINLGSGGNVPVAIFSETDFDATTVDPVTVTLAGAPVKLKGKGTPMASAQDVDGDGLLDLVVHVTTSALQLTQADEEAILEGETFDGTRIEGVDTVRVVP